jgi:steroid delta-isomerase-like uncharacterized protein
MSPEEMKALKRRFYEEWSKGKAAAMAVIDELYSTDFIFHSGDEFHSLKDYKQSMSEFYNAFPDLHITIDDVIVEGNKVAARWTVTGTHKGEREGIPPTDKKVTMWAITIYRVVGGKVVEEWSRYDTLGMMQQLGLIPTPKK